MLCWTHEKDEISCRITPCSLVNTVQALHISDPPVQCIQKTEFIYHQCLLYIEKEQEGVEEWSAHAQTVVLPSPVGV